MCRPLLWRDNHRGLGLCLFTLIAITAAKLLIAEGAVVKARDDYGRTPLRLAKDAVHIEMIDLLQYPRRTTIIA